MEKERLARVPFRRFHHAIKAGKKGVYRLMLVGCRDNVATVRLDKGLRFGIAGHPLWLHGHGEQLRRSYVYIPRGTRSISFGFLEFDTPRKRRYKLIAPDGEVLVEGCATGGFDMIDSKRHINKLKAGLAWEGDQYDDKLMVFEVSEGKNDFMIHMLLNNPSCAPGYHGRTGGVPAFFCPDKDTARALQGGAIYHDGKILWHMFQTRLHDWLKTNLSEKDFIPLDAEGKPIKIVKGGIVLKGLPTNPKPYIPMNGFHHGGEPADRIMHNYAAHKNREALNLAIRNLAVSLESIGPGDIRFTPGYNGNTAFTTASHVWYPWHTAWLMLKEPDVPVEVKAIVREAFIALGDAIAFGRNQERVLANAYFNIVGSLRYCVAATGDPLQKRMFELYFDRYRNGGWGEGVGMSPSGTHYEHFAHAYHYGGYVINSCRGPAQELGDKRFAEIRRKLIWFYQHMRCPETPANMWSSRTAYDCNEMKALAVPVEKRTRRYPWMTDKAYPWMGEPGPAFTRNINDGDEFFAARRKRYYVTTFHGMLAPMWLNNYFKGSRLGYGGGAITQFAVSGKGAVLVASLNGSYGSGMHPNNWRNFHIHSVVGTTADDRPLIAADSEHLNAKLDGNTLTSSGEIRDCPVRSSRKYVFGDNDVTCSVQLEPTGFKDVMWKMGRKSAVKEAYEMIPYVPWALGKKPGRKDKGKLPEADRTKTFVSAADGKKTLLNEDMQTTRTVIIDRGGFGVRIEFETERKVCRGNNSTVLVELAKAEKGRSIPVEDIGIEYRLVPFAQ
jgi:hypothetical protein